MKIVDYENNRPLTDVAIILSADEVAELAAYLNRLVLSPELHTVYLSNVNGVHIERELSVTLSQAA